MRSRCFAVLLIPLLSAAIAAQGTADRYANPDSPTVHAAARAALANAKILDIVGISRGIDGLLKDLGAKVTASEIKIELAADVLFDFDSAQIRQDAAGALGKVSEVLQGYPTFPVSIEGHTDSKGSDPYNQKLSEDRARSVKDWLVKPGGIPASRMTTTGWGKSKPVALNAKPDGSDDPQGRQQNRRVEITVRKT